MNDNINTKNNIIYLNQNNNTKVLSPDLSTNSFNAVKTDASRSNVITPLKVSKKCDVYVNDEKDTYRGKPE